MTVIDRDEVFRGIRESINRFGYHLYVVSGGPLPRFSYTIGVSEKSINAELIFAGGMLYMAEQVEEIINSAIRVLGDSKVDGKISFSVESLGNFELQKAHKSWVSPLALGVFDFFQKDDVCLLQVRPESANITIDVPNMSEQWDAVNSSAWRWLYEPWNYPFPPESTATTNVDALRGKKITEAARWELSEWELFAGEGPSVTRGDIRVIPIGTLLATDESLSPIIDLEVGQALWRDSVELIWHSWRKETGDM